MERMACLYSQLGITATFIAGWKKNMTNGQCIQCIIGFVFVVVVSMILGFVFVWGKVPLYSPE